MIIVRKKSILSIFVLAVLVVCFSGAADASTQPGPEPDFKPVADEIISANGITWVPKMSYARLILTISRPDGTVFQKTFESGSTPYVGLTGIFGDTPYDGSYTYELRVIPSTESVIRGKSTAAVAKEKRLQGHKALTQAGYFSVSGGMIVTPGAIERENVTSTAQDGLSGAKDQVILDDLIVDGSICAGFDCVNGESFGFDTLRLKENNLRIKFQDTSNSASFPSNDWQITVNDSSNGGANKFSIDDIDGGRTPFTIEAGAPSHSLYVDDGGRVGFGTSTPVADLHVKNGNTPTLRLEQDGSSGFTAQTWDVAGNEANFFIRDATNGSELPLRIIPGAPSNSFYITSSGDIGMGTTSPGGSLHVNRSTGEATDLLALTNNSPTRILFQNTASPSLWRFNSPNNGDFRISEENGGSDVEFTLTSTGNLTITGSLTTSGCTGCDFVFEPDYPLMPLKELSEFIKKEKHLPEIQKAEDMKENGVNMSEFQMKLLQKVEELTIYTISQEETIEKLKARLAALEEKLQERDQ